MTQALRIRNPYTGVFDYTLDEPDPMEIESACSRLRQNQPDWARLTLSKRIASIQSFGKAILNQRDALLAALIADTGRTHVAAMEIDTLAAFVARLTRDAPLALAGQLPVAASIPGIEGSSQRIPYGLVGNISPWNFPVILSFLDTFPALAAGNAVVIKPSEVTPRWIEPMRTAIAACPDISLVLDIIAGAGPTGAAVCEHADALVFTGSVPTGRRIAETAARRFIPAHLELGGKDPAVVLSSADLDLAARTATFCSVQSSGQACQSIERVYVARDCYAEFVSKSVAYARSLQINYPNIDRGVLGPFIFAAQAHKVMTQIEDAVAKGAKVHCGGRLIDHGGLWIEPTVLTNVNHDMLVMQEETFGPVMPIMPFDSDEQAAQLANDSQYGLSAAVFAGDVSEGREFAKRIHAGAVSVNDAALTVVIHEFEHDSFGYSGLGVSRAGHSAYQRFTREQSIMANLGDRPVLPGMLGGN